MEFRWLLKHEKIVEEKKSTDCEVMRKFKRDDHLDAKRVNQKEASKGAFEDEKWAKKRDWKQVKEE